MTSALEITWSSAARTRTEHDGGAVGRAGSLGLADQDLFWAAAAAAKSSVPGGAAGVGPSADGGRRDKVRRGRIHRSHEHVVRVHSQHGERLL